MTPLSHDDSPAGGLVVGAMPLGSRCARLAFADMRATIASAQLARRAFARHARARDVRR